MTNNNNNNNKRNTMIQQDTIITINKSDVLGSISHVAGRRCADRVPAGTYKVSNPIGGSATRTLNNRTTLIPATQIHNAGYDGSYWDVSTFSLAIRIK
jgi:hypothetical protein